MSAYTEYFDAVKACSVGAQKALMKVWNAIDFSNPGLARDMLLETLPPIVDMYGGAAAEAAAEMYEAVLEAETTIKRKVQLSAVKTDGITKSVRYAAGFIFDGDEATALTVLQKALDYHVQKPARDTVEHNAFIDRKNGARYARVPQGPTTCEFCVMLASRGFVYKSKQTADTVEGKGGYHTDCDCLPVVSFVENPVVEGYDQKYYEELYKQMKDKDKWNRAQRNKKAKLKQQNSAV